MGRAPCCDKANVKRGPWSPDEDAMLRSYVERHGTGGNWIALPQKAGLRRCGKSCRLRWLNYLRPDIKHGGFTEEEDNVIYSLYRSIGSRWSVIASRLPGRTDNDVKNYWNTKLKRRLINAAPIPLPSATAAAPLAPPPPPLPSVKAEVFDWAAFGFGPDSYRFLQSDLPPFTVPAEAGLLHNQQPDQTANATPENSSAASSSAESNWSANGCGSDDPFLSELGFQSYSEFLNGGAYAEVGQVYSSGLAPKPEGCLYQSISY